MALQNLKQTLESWLKQNALSLRANWENESIHLFDVISQKNLTLNLNEIKQFRLAENSQGYGTYLNLLLNSNVELILCHVGIAFSPNFASTGSVPDAPPVVCLQDFNRLFQNLLHLLNEKERKSDTLQLFQLLISILDGAKSIGLNVDAEEKELDAQLTQFESSFSK